MTDNDKNAPGGASLFSRQRREQIIDILEKEEAATVKQLARRLYASESTVRRDLRALEKAGSVARMYGGAMPTKKISSDPPRSMRGQKNAEKKELIAENAVKLVYEGATVMLDASSSAEYLAKRLRGFHELTVITNCLNIVETLGECDVRVFCTGGRYLPYNSAFVGGRAEEVVGDFRPDLLFFSSQGITEDGDITDTSEEETDVRRAMIAAAKKSYFLCDDTKLGKSFVFHLCRAGDITGIISNVPFALKNGK